jgi:hypothetical protein
LEYVFDRDYPQSSHNSLKAKPSFLFGCLSEQKVPDNGQMEVEDMEIEDGRAQAENDIYLKMLEQSRRISQRESDPSESEWSNSHEFDDEDE